MSYAEDIKGCTRETPTFAINKYVKVIKLVDYASRGNRWFILKYEEMWD
jgi:hypothetical protein